MNAIDQALLEKLKPAVLKKMREDQFDDDLSESLLLTFMPLASWIAEQKMPLVLGINGAQGSGKSTLCEYLKLVLSQGFKLKVAGFSIDDLYKTHSQRQALAQQIHPLLATRGVPGTHDVDLGIKVISDLIDKEGLEVSIPLFDKALDDRKPLSEWPKVKGPFDVVIFEGWCVAAKPQTKAALLQPVNELEKIEDPDGTWRNYVNQQLEGPYAALFKRIDKLIMLKVPDMECVFKWRSLQEQKLAAKCASSGQNRLMDPDALKRFIMHYERLTRHALDEMPNRADFTLDLNEQHQFYSIRSKASR